MEFFGLSEFLMLHATVIYGRPERLLQQRSVMLNTHQLPACFVPQPTLIFSWLNLYIQSIMSPIDSTSKIYYIYMNMTLSS